MFTGTIELQEKVVYGKPRYYPANHLAEKILALMEQKAFTTTDLPRLKELGLNVQIKPPLPSELPWVLRGEAERAGSPRAQKPLEVRPEILEPTLPKKEAKPLEVQSVPNNEADEDENVPQLPIWRAP